MQGCSVGRECNMETGVGHGDGMRYSVLMSVYRNENPAYLESAIESVLQQTVKTDDFLIVWDGRLTRELECLLTKYQVEYPQVMRFLKIKTNVGLGRALRRGVLECRHSLIARMDSDDIAVPRRFEWQLEEFLRDPDLMLCGGQIEEFVSDPNVPQNKRGVPCDFESILAYARKRNPMNHMTVMFRKSAVLEVGNYLPMDFAEDYYLWVRMLVKGFRTCNLPKVLVKARVGNGMFGRRGGLHYAVSITRLMGKFYEIGFLGRCECVRNIAARIFVSLLPTGWRMAVYQTRLRS